jgi:HPt (histidine-containing phosphotransfer) domain-containing protein
MTTAAGDVWRVRIDDPTLFPLASAYLDRRRAQLSQLRGALERGDFEALWFAAHRMHGAGGAYGVQRISEIGAALEISAFEKDGPRVREGLDQLENFLARVQLVAGTSE